MPKTIVQSPSPSSLQYLSTSLNDIIANDQLNDQNLNNNSEFVLLKTLTSSLNNEFFVIYTNLWNLFMRQVDEYISNFVNYCQKNNCSIYAKNLSKLYNEYNISFIWYIKCNLVIIKICYMNIYMSVFFFC